MIKFSALLILAVVLFQPSCANIVTPIDSFIHIKDDYNEYYPDEGLTLVLGKNDQGFQHDGKIESVGTEKEPYIVISKKNGSHWGTALARQLEGVNVVHKKLQIKYKSREDQHVTFTLAQSKFPYKVLQNHNQNHVVFKKGLQTKKVPFTDLVKDPNDLVDINYVIIEGSMKIFQISLISDAKPVNVKKLEYSGNVIPPRGIYNNGNMCYMNVILQVLVHSPAFRNMVMQPSTSGHVLSAVRHLVHQYLATDSEGINAGDVFEAIKDQTPFVKGRQEDAHEFLGYLLQAMHLEYEQHKSPITQLFTGTTRSVLKVGNDVRDRVSFEEFQCLPVDINSNRVHSVSDAVKCMLEPELISVLPGGSHLYKELHFVDLPVILVVQLNRFTYTNDQIAKVTKHVEIDQVLQINGQTYNLFGVVNHHGRVANGGHYTCDVVQHATTWVRMDDSVVRTISEDDVVAYKRDREPYLLFYESAQQVLRIAQPDLVRAAAAGSSTPPAPLNILLISVFATTSVLLSMVLLRFFCAPGIARANAI